MHETYDAEILRQPAPAAAPQAIGPRLGIVRGGQLARMTATATLQLGCDVVVLERNAFSPAAWFKLDGAVFIAVRPALRVLPPSA